MSLKAFHLVFIAVSAAMALGVGYWGVRAYWLRADVPALALGLACAAVGCGLLFYARAYLHKMKEVGYW